jgi:hypothetical protein
VPARALSLMAHLVEPEGTTVAVGDSLGYPIEQWQPDDTIIQTHKLVIPQDASTGKYAVRIGGYWLDTMKRWSIQGEPDEDFLDVASVEVR